MDQFVVQRPHPSPSLSSPSLSTEMNFAPNDSACSLVSDLISANRRLIEDALLRIKRIELFKKNEGK